MSIDKKVKDIIKKGGQLEDGPPDVERISPHEVYLLNEEGERTRRICGAQRKNMPEGFVCVNKAGQKTTHPGYGACQFHDYSIPNANNTGLWDRLNRQAGLPSTLAEHLANAQEIEEQHLTTVDEDIKALYGLMSYQMAKRQNSEPGGDDVMLTNADLELALKIMDKIIKAKEVKVKLSKELMLDTSTIKAFVKQIVKVVSQKLPEHQAKAVLSSILDEVIMPFQTQGRIIGGKDQYTPMSKDLMNQFGDGNG